MLAIVGAEYVTRLVPRGTHEYERMIRPSELAQWARESQLVIDEFAGLEYNPITRSTRLTADVSVNYLAHIRRADSAK
jgi:2-polyprenyl-6-hydroxyphenyl methylase/3-demethylubiquinone-9 3-methyltransferase